ncbi:hypothetical protein E2I00_002122, partial [Balaenoptera physalus]
GKPDLNTALPVRQTASIFKQPVTKITNHPSNKVKSDPQKAVEQPRQMGCALASGSSCVPRRQEELVQQVRKRLEEALMADMLAHVEELARDGEAPLDRVGADEDEDDEDQEEGPDQDQEMEHV